MAALSGIRGRRRTCNLFSQCSLFSCSSWHQMFVTMSNLCPPLWPNSHFWKEQWNLFAYEKSKAQSSGLCCTLVQKKDARLLDISSVLSRNLVRIFLWCHLPCWLQLHHWPYQLVSLVESFAHQPHWCHQLWLHWLNCLVSLNCLFS